MPDEIELRKELIIMHEKQVEHLKSGNNVEYVVMNIKIHVMEHILDLDNMEVKEK